MISARLVDALYTDAMLLADEARGYFDDEGSTVRDALPPLERVVFSCESLKITTRLMHVIAWLLTQRAVAAGELGEHAEPAASRDLGPAVPSDAGTLATMPAQALRLVAASIELHARAGRLERGIATVDPVASPARHLQRRLQQSF